MDLSIKNLMKFSPLLEKGFCYCFSCWVVFTLFSALGWISHNYFYVLTKILMFLWGIWACFKYNNIIKGINGLMLFFIIYILLSGLVYFFNNRPIDCYLDSLDTFVNPMLLFFSGIQCKRKHDLISIFSIALVFVLIISLIAYITLSSWYVDYITSLRTVRLDADVDISYMESHLRFSATMASSYFVMYMCLPVLAFHLNKILIDNNGGVLNYVICVVCIISLFLCQQRTAILFAFLSVPFFLFFLDKRGRYAILTAVILIAIIYFFGEMALTGHFSNISEMVSERIEKMSFSEAYGERRDLVNRVFPVWSNTILGDGVGVYSHTAHYAGYISVNDNAYIKLLVENGVVGLLLYSVIIISTLIKAFKNSRLYCSEILIILFFSVAMIGSDSLSMVSFYSIFFWFSIGSVWNKSVERKVVY